MKLSFNSKSQEFGLDGSIVGTRVVLANNEGGFLPVMLEADKIELSNSELEKLALDVVYQKVFRDKYENEKFGELNEKIANYEELINTMKLSMEESDKMLQLTTATLNELISNMHPDDGITDATTEGTTGGTTEGATDETTQEN